MKNVFLVILFCSIPLTAMDKKLKKPEPKDFATGLRWVDLEIKYKEKLAESSQNTKKKKGKKKKESIEEIILQKLDKQEKEIKDLKDTLMGLLAFSIRTHLYAARHYDHYMNRQVGFDANLDEEVMKKLVEENAAEIICGPSMRKMQQEQEDHEFMQYLEQKYANNENNADQE